MKRENRVLAVHSVPHPVNSLTLTVAIAGAMASLSLSACSPIAPSLLKDSSLRGTLGGPQAGALAAPLPPAQDLSESDDDALSSSSADETGTTGHWLIEDSSKTIRYETEIELSSEDGSCHDSSCPLPEITDHETESGRRLQVSFGDVLRSQLLDKGEARFVAPLDFIPAVVKAKLRLRESTGEIRSTERVAPDSIADETGRVEPIQWDQLELILEPLVTTAAGGQHWVVKLPGNIPDAMLAALKENLESLTIEFEGAPDSELITGTDTAHEETKPRSPQSQRGGSLTPVESADKAKLNRALSDKASIR